MLDRPPIERLRAPGRAGLGSALAVAWLLLVACLALAQHTVGVPDSDDLASTPAGIAAGRLWTLLSSGFVVMGPPVLEVIGMAVLLWICLRRLGAGGFWVAAAAGHLGATLVAYAGIGLLWLVARPAVASVIDEPDYGISAVAAGAIGALLTLGVLRSRRHRHATTIVALACAAAFAALVPLGGGLADVEHLLAFLLGAAVTAVRLQRRPGRVTAGT